MQEDKRWRHKNRICKRNLKSIYFDKEDMTLKQATHCPSYPPVRPTRYIFIGQFINKPKIDAHKVLSILSKHGITLKKINKHHESKGLPF